MLPARNDLGSADQSEHWTTAPALAGAGGQSLVFALVFLM
jgi:hypothetical protein